MSLELKQAENGFWYIHWTEGRRSQRVSTRAKDLDGAKKFFATWLACEQQIVVPGTTHAVRELWKVYYDRHARPKTTTRAADDAWKNLRVMFENLMLPQVADAVEDYKVQRRAGTIGRPSVDGTIRRELAVLRACLRWCASPKTCKPRPLIDKNDVPEIDLPAAGKPRKRWLREEEIARLLAAAAAMRKGPRLSRGERFLHLALETGARKTAILELTWDRVDLETRAIDYNVPGETQRRKERAVVPISDALFPILARAYAERLDPERLDGHVMDHPRDRVWMTVSAIAERAQLDGVSPHVLRHTAATHMARRGVSAWHISSVLGNTEAMVAKVYRHQSVDNLRAAVNSISRPAE